MIIGVVAIAVLICGFFAYKNLYVAKQERAALAAMYPAQNQYAIDSFHIALYGNENVTGFEDIVKEYGSVCNVSYFYAGSCAIHLGEFQAAIDYLEDFSSKDPILQPEALCLIGDAYSELENYKKAASYYEKAAKVADTELLSPRFLIKAGLVYEKMGAYSDALKAYNTIKEKYSGAQEMNAVEKYITRAQLRK